jgi:hypothetical protein
VVRQGGLKDEREKVVGVLGQQAPEIRVLLVARLKLKREE